MVVFYGRKKLEEGWDSVWGVIVWKSRGFQGATWGWVEAGWNSGINPEVVNNGLLDHPFTNYTSPTRRLRQRLEPWPDEGGFPRFWRSDQQVQFQLLVHDLTCASAFLFSFSASQISWHGQTQLPLLFLLWLFWLPLQLDPSSWLFHPKFFRGTNDWEINSNSLLKFIQPGNDKSIRNMSTIPCNQIIHFLWISLVSYCPLCFGNFNCFRSVTFFCRSYWF